MVTSGRLVELVELFRHSSAVVGVHGPLMSLLIFCKRDTPVLEIGFLVPQVLPRTPVP